MSFKKSFGLISLGALVGALTYGCSSTSSSTASGDDGGVSNADGGKDGAAHHDGSAEAGDDGATPTGCMPGDVSTFMPPAYKTANKVAGACTAAFITTFYDNCLAANATAATCGPWTGMSADAAHKTCAACLVTLDTAAQYGALIEHKGTVAVNVPGCMELKDPANGLACAKKYQASEMCNDAACAANCPVTDDASFQLYQACVQQASQNGCATYTMGAACADAEADGGAAAVCFQGQSFQDLYNSVAPIFCGP